jgi:hypothetical protein
VQFAAQFKYSADYSKDVMPGMGMRMHSVRQPISAMDEEGQLCIVDFHKAFVGR